MRINEDGEEVFDFRMEIATTFKGNEIYINARDIILGIRDAASAYEKVGREEEATALRWFADITDVNLIDVSRSANE